MIKRCEDILSNGDAHQRGPQQRRIIRINWMLWCILWIPVSLIPQPTLSSLRGCMKKVAMVAVMEVMCELSMWTSTHQGNRAMPSTGRPVCQQQRPTLSSKVIRELAAWRQVDEFWPLYYERGRNYSFWSRHLSVYRFSFFKLLLKLPLRTSRMPYSQL